MTGRFWLWVLCLGAAAACGGYYLQEVSREQIKMCESALRVAVGSSQAVALECYLDAIWTKRVATLVSVVGFFSVVTALFVAYKRGSVQTTP